MIVHCVSELVRICNRSSRLVTGRAIDLFCDLAAARNVPFDRKLRDRYRVRINCTSEDEMTVGFLSPSVNTHQLSRSVLQLPRVFYVFMVDAEHTFMILIDASAAHYP